MYTSLFKVFVLALFLSLCASIEDDDTCPNPKIGKKTIIRSKESIANGAKLLRRVIVESAKYCYRLCCGTEDCNLAVMHYKPSEYDKTEKWCYLFSCGSPSVCTFDYHTQYAVIKIDRPSKISQKEEECPAGAPVAMCADDPCEVHTCPANEEAICKANYCGGCHAFFYDENKERVNCTLPETPKPSFPSGEDTNYNVLDANEQSLTVGSTDYAEAPAESLPGAVQPEKTTDKPRKVEDKESDGEDPYYQTERRTWMTGPGEEKEQAKPRATTEVPNTKENGKTEVIIETVDSNMPSVPLLVALIMCIFFIIGLIYHFRCRKRGKPKKLPVDDGDYLINGMYL